MHNAQNTKKWEEDTALETGTSIPDSNYGDDGITKPKRKKRTNFRFLSGTNRNFDDRLSLCYLWPAGRRPLFFLSSQKLLQKKIQPDGSYITITERRSLLPRRRSSNPPSPPSNSSAVPAFQKCFTYRRREIGSVISFHGKPVLQGEGTRMAMTLPKSSGSWGGVNEYEIGLGEGPQAQSLGYYLNY